MHVLTAQAAMVLAVAALGLHCVAVLLVQSLRAYSRSRLEELCAKRGRAARADEIARDDVPAERASEHLVTLTGLALAGLAGITIAATENRTEAIGLLVLGLGLGGLAHMLAAVVGRAYAESVADALWPIAKIVRKILGPFAFVTRHLESMLERRARGGLVPAPRPHSVEVEIHTRTEDESQEEEADLPESIRAMLERAAALRDRDVASLMTPRSTMTVLAESVSLDDAARTFLSSGLSRIPLYGEHRDDIVGVLYVKDLIPFLLDAQRHPAFHARALARPAEFVPETKPASDMLDELRTKRIALAIVLDEFGSVSGLITLEDLLEAIVGPIDDEHDTPTPADLVHAVDDRAFEVDATVPLEELNERLGLDLPTDGDYQTLGGLALDALGRVPEAGATFHASGAEFTVLDVVDHAVKRIRIELDARSEPVARA